MMHQRSDHHTSASTREQHTRLPLSTGGNGHIVGDVDKEIYTLKHTRKQEKVRWQPRGQVAEVTCTYSLASHQKANFTQTIFVFSQDVHGEVFYRVSRAEQGVYPIGHRCMYGVCPVSFCVGFAKAWCCCRRWMQGAANSRATARQQRRFAFRTAFDDRK